MWERSVLHVAALPTKLLAVERLLTGLPFSLAESAGLQRVNHTQRFFRRAADVQVMHDFVTQHAFGIDHEEAAQRDAFILNQHAVIRRYLLRPLRAGAVTQTFHATLVARRVQPRAVRVNGVSRD